MFSLSTRFKYFSRVLKTADVIVLLFILSIVIRDLIEMISVSPPDPPCPVLVRLSVIFSHQIFWPIFSGWGIVLLLFTAWRGLHPVVILAAVPVSPKTVSRCAETVTRGEEVDTGDYGTPDLVTPSPPPIMGQCGNIENSFHPHLTPTSHSYAQ